jgi:hypothetical protein
MKRPRKIKVYANFHSGFAEAFSSREYAKAGAGGAGLDSSQSAVPCLLIPLTPAVISELRTKVRQAINYWYDGECGYLECLEGSTDGAMLAIGIKVKKGGAS